MWYLIGTTAGRIYLNLSGELVVSGIENVPSEGRVILASNHKSNIDPFCIAAAMRRQVHFLAKEELFRNPVLGWLMRKWGTIKVRRGAADRKAIAAAIETLKQGHVLGVFVEGTRRRDIQGIGDLRTGAAMLSHYAQAPIVPVAIWRDGKRVHVSFGPPIAIDNEGRTGETLSRKDIYSRTNDALANALNALLRTPHAESATH